MTTKEVTSNYRTTARVVGVVYLAGFVVGLGGEALIQSSAEVDLGDSAGRVGGSAGLGLTYAFGG